MADDTKRVERVRDDRVHDATRERARPRPKESDFEKMLEKSRMPGQLQPQGQVQSKTLTEEAIKEAFKREDRQKDEGKKDQDEKKEGRDSRGKSEKSEGSVAGQKVVAKDVLKRDGGDGGRRDGFGAGAGRRELSKALSRANVKSLPADLQGRFAARMADAMKNQPAAGNQALAQHILNKIVQYVRIGLNRKGEKEIQVDLNERIFRGLKLRVIARGGKVGVEFQTAGGKGKAALLENKDALMKAMERKGISVDEIVVR